MSEFALQVQDIDENGKAYSFELTRPWLEETLAEANLHADVTAEPGVIEVHAQKNGTEYLVTGRVRVALTTECGRCLGIAKIPVDTRFATLFIRAAHQPGKHSVSRHTGQGAAGKDPAPQHTASDDEPEETDELAREEFSGHEIVLDPLIREYLVLEAPMQPLCSEECTGIAVPEHVRPPEEVFGTSDSKVDPRLAPLLRLRDKVPPNKE
jgi:uncharacterized protein